MMPEIAPNSREAANRRSEALAPTCRGLNYYEADPHFRAILPLHASASLLSRINPHLVELGELAGNELYDLSEACPPILHTRDAYGRDEEWIEYHPVYRRMEEIAFGRFGIHAMSHCPGVLDQGDALPPLAKYVFHYVFAQAEFGLLCPVNPTDSSSELIRRFGSEPLREPIFAGGVVARHVSAPSLRAIHDGKGGRLGCRRFRARSRARW
ncbi:hypothetical protein [Bradyrhizobium sp. 139]|uniref:hypothetical protein n=1 Tax=Bradyrhizobium sp. 139 TaxID=2782616 RepID=UPI001FF8C650|nr:hypothetical protein [Bradyrhizobium sp. 139]